MGQAVLQNMHNNNNNNNNNNIIVRRGHFGALGV
jgi:hypothetical protein